MKRCLPAALLAVGAILFGCSSEPELAPVEAATVETPESSTQAPSGLPLVPLEILSGGRSHKFKVEVAQTPEEQAQGLMFRKSLAPDGGMLFPFNPPKPASFWMKNTLIPLDMIFIRNDGTIERIATAVPRSLESVTSRGPVIAVLEIAGGRAKQLGIKEGDRAAWTGGPQP